LFYFLCAQTQIFIVIRITVMCITIKKSNYFVVKAFQSKDTGIRFRFFLKKILWNEKKAVLLQHKKKIITE